MLGKRVLGEKAFAEQEAVRVIGADQLGWRVVGRPVVAAAPAPAPVSAATQESVTYGATGLPPAYAESDAEEVAIAQRLVDAPDTVRAVVSEEVTRDGGPRARVLLLCRGPARAHAADLVEAIDEAIAELQG